MAPLSFKYKVHRLQQQLEEAKEMDKRRKTEIDDMRLLNKEQKEQIVTLGEKINYLMQYSKGKEDDERGRKKKKKEGNLVENRI